MFHASVFLAATNYTKNTGVHSIPPIEQDEVDCSESTIPPRCNSMEILSLMRMYNQTLTQAKHSHSQQIKRLAAVLESLYHTDNAHRLLASTVLYPPHHHISNLKQSFTRYVFPTMQNYKQFETRVVVSPKPFPAETNTEEQDDGAWPILIQVISTTTQPVFESNLDMTLPIPQIKMSVHENCHKPSQIPGIPRDRKGRKLFFVMSTMLSPTNEAAAGPALHKIRPTACDYVRR